MLPHEELALLLSQGGRGPNSIDPRCVPTINSLQLHSPAQKIRLRDCVRTQKTGTCFCFCDAGRLPPGLHPRNTRLSSIFFTIRRGAANCERRIVGIESIGNDGNAGWFNEMSPVGQNSFIHLYANFFRKNGKMR